MTIEEVVRKVLLDEHADVIREAVKAVAARMMELEVSELIGAQHGKRGFCAAARGHDAFLGTGSARRHGERPHSCRSDVAAKVTTAVAGGSGRLRRGPIPARSPALV